MVTEIKKVLPFQKNCARIGVDIEKAQMVQVNRLLCRSSVTFIESRLTTDDYTFFRERESPAESSLKNKVIIDFHTGAAFVNQQGYIF